MTARLMGRGNESAERLRSIILAAVAVGAGVESLRVMARGVATQNVVRKLCAESGSIDGNSMILFVTCVAVHGHGIGGFVGIGRCIVVGGHMRIHGSCYGVDVILGFLSDLIKRMACEAFLGFDRFFLCAREKSLIGSLLSLTFGGYGGRTRGKRRAHEHACYDYGEVFFHGIESLLCMQRMRMGAGRERSPHPPDGCYRASSVATFSPAMRAAVA